MTLDEFVKTANLRGLANKEIAREYGKGRAEFTCMEPGADYTDTTQDYTDEEADNG
jgi:hypothetical protein